MRLTKWIFLGYLALVAAIIAGLGAAMTVPQHRDPDTLYTVYSATIRTLDPADMDDTASEDIGGDIYECLYNYRYGKDPYELFPELAADMPKVSKDGKVVTIKIRPGIRFYDPDKKIKDGFKDGVGPEVTAADFIYSWKRVCEFHLASPLYSQIFQGRIVGLDDWWAYTKSVDKDKIYWDRPVAGLVALDKYTLQITLIDPFPQLKFNLAYTPTAVVCQKAIEFWGDDYQLHPIGTGPYALKDSDNVPQQHIILTANPIYRGRPDVDGDAKVAAADRLPRIQRVEFQYFEESLPVWFIFQKGLLDVSGISKDTFKQAISIHTGNLTPEMSKKGIVLTKSSEPTVEYYGFNMTDKVVGKNKPLRQAISMALDRAKYIEIYVNGRGDPAIGPLAPGLPCYDDKLKNPYTRYDLAAAREKLQEAVKINGGPIPTLHIVFGETNTDARQEGSFFVAEMKDLGLDFDVQYLNWARFLDEVDGRQPQVFRLAWLADYPDGQDFFQLFYGKNAPPGGSNPTGYVNPAFDAIYDKASVMEKSPERDKLYAQMQQIVMEDCPWAMIDYPKDYGLHFDWLQFTHHMDYGYGLEQYPVLDGKLRTERLEHGLKCARGRRPEGRFPN